MSDTDELNKEPPKQQPTEFEVAAQEEPVGLLTEFWLFLKEEKKWWLTPIILMLLLIGGIAFFSATGAAPFIYSLF